MDLGQTPLAPARRSLAPGAQVVKSRDACRARARGTALGAADDMRHAIDDAIPQLVGSVVQLSRVGSAIQMILSFRSQYLRHAECFCDLVAHIFNCQRNLTTELLMQVRK